MSCCSVVARGLNVDIQNSKAQCVASLGLPFSSLGLLLPLSLWPSLSYRIVVRTTCHPKLFRGKAGCKRWANFFPKFPKFLGSICRGQVLPLLEKKSCRGSSLPSDLDPFPQIPVVSLFILW